MKHRLRLIPPMAAALLAALLVCFAPAGQAEQVVGVFAPLTGAHAPIGQSIRNGVVLALEQAEDGGLFGEVRLSIRTLDDSGTPQAVAERIAKFVRDEQAILVIGPAISAHAEAAADRANHAQFPLLAPGGSEGINAKGKWAFRLSMSPYKTLHALAAYAVALQAGAPGSPVRASTSADTPAGGRLALVHAKGNPGYASQAAEFRTAAVRAGARVAGQFEADVASDFVALTAAAVRAAGADVVFFAMDAEPAAALAYEIATPAHAAPSPAPGGTGSDAGQHGRPLFVFPPAAAQPALARIGRAAVEGALTAADYLPEAPLEGNDRFRNAYRSRFGAEADSWSGVGYAAGQLAAEAIRNAGPSPNTHTVRLALERVTQAKLLIGGGHWQQDGARNPLYTPQMYRLSGGRLVPAVPAAPAATRHGLQ